MAIWLATDKDGTEWIFETEPLRADCFWGRVRIDESQIEASKGTILRLIGRALIWTDEPVEVSGYDECENTTSKYLFWFESEGKEGWTFEIEACNHEDAYTKAYDTHGPQVEGMLYQLI